MTDLAALSEDWVRQLPRPFVRDLATALRHGPPAVQHLAGQVAAPASLHAARQAFDVAGAGDGPYLAGLIDGWSAATAKASDVQPVWTGPASSVRGGRLTLAVVADPIAEAQQEILLVSFATYPPAGVTAALVSAAERGVSVTLLLERSEDKPGWNGMLEPFPELKAMQLCWPLAERPPRASLHAKVLVIDRRVAVVGSANLTEWALERNLECGLLVRGGPVPGLLAEHLTTAQGLVRA